MVPNSRPGVVGQASRVQWLGRYVPSTVIKRLGSRLGHPDGSLYGGLKRVSASDAALSSGGAMEMPDDQPSNSEEEQTPEVFPRVKERDPYRLLGVSKSATFEEIQDARNYYFETYRQHEASREAIEMAFDTVLQDKMKSRQKYGFRPPKTGRKSDVDAEPEGEGLMEKLKNIFEPSVAGTTMVNDGFIYFMLSCWAAGTQHAAGDPTAPFVVALGFCCWRLFDKRSKRNPDGPYFGNSPIWGALGTAMIGFCFALVVANVVVSILPLPPKFSAAAAGAFLATLVVGVTSIFVK